jgi:N utilization substance protein B
MYELDTNNAFNTPQEDLKSILERNIVEFAPEKLDKAFAVDLLKEIVSRISTLDEIIEKSAPEWPIDKINIVDRNIIRLGLCELLFGQDKVPPKVAIDESIELAKEFGGDASSKFINGVLGAVYKELGEPEKDSKPKNILPVEYKAGAVIYALDENQKLHIALVHDVFGRWTLVKGDVLDIKDIASNLQAEIKTKIGVHVDVVKKILNINYIAHNPSKGKITKDVTYFLVKTEFADVKIGEAETGLDDVKWFTTEETEDVLTYDDLKNVISVGVATAKEIENLI